jgi:hypothetical protein
MAIWFTAHTHLGYSSIIRHCQRPRAGVEEMYRTQFLRQVEVGIRAASPRRMRRCATGVR